MPQTLTKIKQDFTEGLSQISRFWGFPKGWEPSSPCCISPPPRSLSTRSSAIQDSPKARSVPRSVRWHAWTRPSLHETWRPQGLLLRRVRFLRGNQIHSKGETKQRVRPRSPLGKRDARKDGRKLGGRRRMEFRLRARAGVAGVLRRD
jgi:hypothetical protein